MRRPDGRLWPAFLPGGTALSGAVPTLPAPGGEGMSAGIEAANARRARHRVHAPQTDRDGTRSATGKG